MLWEELTAKGFPDAVKKSKGVCVIPLGVIEKHGEHLPLGTDYFIARNIAIESAKQEPCIIFPPYYFTQIHEAKHQPGAIALSGKMIWNLLEECCNEVSRNGLKKIILLNWHGGNINFLPYFVFMMLEKERDYVVYLPQGGTADPKFEAEVKKKLKSKKLHSGHASYGETSMIMSIHPDLVNMKDIPPGVEESHERLKHLPDIYTPIWWYAIYPDHYQGDAKPATPEAGDLMFEQMVRHMVKVIKEVKYDQAALKLMKEFYKRTKHEFV